MMDGSSGYVYELDDGGYAQEILILTRRQEEMALTNELAKERVKNLTANVNTMRSSIHHLRSGVGQMMGSMLVLTGGVRGADENMNRMRMALMVSYTTAMIYSTVVGILKTITAIKSAQAAGETAAAAAAQQWHAIAIAAAATGIVGASFAVGYQFGSGNWTFNADISTPQGRRKAASQLEEVRTPSQEAS